MCFPRKVGMMAVVAPVVLVVDSNEPIFGPKMIWGWDFVEHVHAIGQLFGKGNMNEAIAGCVVNTSKG